MLWTKHKFMYRKLTSIWNSELGRFTIALILDTFEPDLKVSDVNKVFRFYRKYKLYLEELRQWLVRDGSNSDSIIYKLVYMLNCPPPGFRSTVKTFHCNNVQICPWCYTRRLFTVYRNTLEVLADLNVTEARIVSWIYYYPYRFGSNDLGFFDARRSPHIWCEAHKTFQIATPILSGNKVFLRHFGLQVVPKDLDVIELFKRKQVIQRLKARNSFKLGTRLFKDSYDLKRVILSCCRQDWNYKFDNVYKDSLFEAYSYLQSNRLLRQSTYTPRRI